MKQMYEDIRSGRRGDFDARDYYHNRIIDRLFKNAKRKAWSSIQDDPRINEEIEKQRLKKLNKVAKRSSTSNILNIYK